MNLKPDTAQRSPQVPLSRALWWGLCLLVGLLAAVPLWGHGMINTRGGGDSPFLLQRTMDMADLIRHGNFPPHWMAHAAYDLGYPFFNYYAALPYYISGGLTAVGINPILAIQTTQTLGFVLAALAMALWAKRVYRIRAAVLLAVIAYTFAPFHIVNVFVRGDSLSEFYAFIWYPLILWALDRLAARPTLKRLGLAALTYGMLILTHNVSAMIFSPFALLYAMLKVTNAYFRRNPGYDRKISPHTGKKGHYILHLMIYAAAPFLLGFLLTAWFWLPAIGETKYGQMGEEFTEGYFHYSQHFRRLDLIQPTLAFNYSVAVRAEDAGPFAMGSIQAVLATVGVGVLLWTLKSGQNLYKEHAHTPVLHHLDHIFILFGLALTTLMLTPLSKPLWDLTPLLQLAQFPWRFLSVQALFTAMSTGSIATWAIRLKMKHASVSPGYTQNNAMQHPSRNFTALAACCILGIVLIWAAFGDLHPDRLNITPDDVTWENLLLYETFTGNIGTTIRHEYLPEAVVPRLYISEAVLEKHGHVIGPDHAHLDAELLTRAPQRQVWRVSLEAGQGPTTFPLNWWPGWQATVDAQPMPIYPMPGSGRVALDLPSGTHTVTLQLRNTPLQGFGIGISALTLIVGAYVLARRSTWPVPFALVKTVGGGLGLLALCLILTALCQGKRKHPHTVTSFDFHQMPYPHGGEVNFSLATLQAATVSHSSAQPGDILTIEHNWDIIKANPLTGTLRLVSPAAPRHNVSYTLRETAFTLTCHTRPCTYTSTLPIPDTVARGLYLIQLRLYGLEGELHAVTPKGRGMGTLYIGAVRVLHGPDVQPNLPVLATFRDLSLHKVTAQQPDARTLRLAMTWSTPGTPRNWSMSLRLLDIHGQPIASENGQRVQLDMQPGYGYLPTTLWLPGEKVTDYPILQLPEGLAPGNYILRVITYLRATWEGGGEVDVPIQLTEATRYDLRDACCEQSRKGATILCQAEGIALLKLNLPDKIIEGHPLDFYAVWNAVGHPDQEVTARWDLRVPQGDLISRSEGPLAPGSSTAMWSRHTWVRAPVHIDLPQQLAFEKAQLYITLLSTDTASIPCLLPYQLPIQSRPRVFTPPAIPHPQSANFGNELALLGYEIDQHADTLSLTLWWQAIMTPQRDYKRFVHIYDPATEEILAQDDAMPRAWTYPTSLWMSEEVVSETLALDMSTVPEGTYHMAVGWYNPENATRLPATDANGASIPLDRIVLETELDCPP